MTAFAKNQKVTLLVNWDSRGTVKVYDLVVYSCGKKQMILVDENGVKFGGRNYRPTENQGNYARVVSRLSREEATALALEIGAAIVAAERASYEDVIRRNIDNHQHVAHLRAEMEKLHEPRAIFFE